MPHNHQELLSVFADFMYESVQFAEKIMQYTDFVLFGKSLNRIKLQRLLQAFPAVQPPFDTFTWQDYQCVTFTAPQNQQPQLLQVAHSLALDCVPLQFDAQLTQAGILVMDMDSTMIQMECIDEIAKRAGTGEEVAAITARAMRGELDFAQSLRQRVATLAGTKESILQQVCQNLPLTDGLIPLVKTLQGYGWKIAIASGGFTYFADVLKQRFQLDAVAANQFDIEQGLLTGKVAGNIVDAKAKAEFLEKFRKSLNIPACQTVAMGDGANDLPMLHAANLGAAFHAKPKVQAEAKAVVNFAGLDGLICLLLANERRLS